MEPAGACPRGAAAGVLQRALERRKARRDELVGAFFSSSFAPHGGWNLEARSLTRAMPALGKAGDTRARGLRCRLWFTSCTTPDRSTAGR